MFSTRLKSDRFYIPCIVMTDVPIIHSFIVDTGAKYTCCSYKNINRDLREEDFKDCEYRLLGGLVTGSEIKFYKYRAKQFTVGNINMGIRDIWITFDDLATDDVLGMDIMKDVTFLGNSNSRELLFFDDSEKDKIVVNL